MPQGLTLLYQRPEKFVTYLLGLLLGTHRGDAEETVRSRRGLSGQESSWDRVGGATTRCGLEGWGVVLGGVGRQVADDVAIAGPAPPPHPEADPRQGFTV